MNQLLSDFKLETVPLSCSEARVLPLLCVSLCLSIIPMCCLGCTLDVGAHFCMNVISCGALCTDRKANKTLRGGNHRFGCVCVCVCVCFVSECGAA